MTRHLRANAAHVETTMKRWMTMMTAALLLAAGAAPARAIGPAIDWDPAYFWQTGGSPSDLPAGGILECVGIVSQFGPPLDFLNATFPGTEYTFYVTGLQSQGTTTFTSGTNEIYSTLYNGGTFELYADASPNAVFAPDPPNPDVPSTFLEDPPALLVGQFTSLHVSTNNFTQFQVGNIEGNIVWTGGTLLPLLAGPGGQPCPGLFTGGATWSTEPGIGIPGYLFRHDGKIDLQCPTPSRKSTWGELKTLYR